MAAPEKKSLGKLATLRDCLSAAWQTARMPGKGHKGPLPPPDASLLNLAAELRQHVSELAEEIGERNVSRRPAQLDQAADYLQAQFAAAGHTVQRQLYDVPGATCANLYVEIAGATRPEEIVVVGAHYDSVPGSPAANDNGSGVAATLCLARLLSGAQSDRTIRLVGFVNEEKPYAHTELMGSWVYARRCRSQGEKIVGMLSLETIGCYSDAPGSQKYPPPLGYIYPAVGDFIAFIGNARSGSLVRRAVRAFRRHEPFPALAGALPDVIPNAGFSDHWSFWQEGYPALMVTDTAPFRYPYYHTPDDTVDKIDFERLARVTRGLHQVMLDLASDSPP